MSYKSGESGCPFLVIDHREKAFRVLLLSILYVTIGFVYIPFIKLRKFYSILTLL